MGEDANLERAYAVLAVEREPNRDVFVVLETPVAADEIAE
jgi:hypothetical protein